MHMSFQEFVGSPALGVGTNFQGAGNLPVVRDKLKIFVTLGTIEGTVAFSILADIASAPVAFLTSREEMRFSTSSSVQRNSSGNLASGK